jgi:anti-sigma factor RsiW
MSPKDKRISELAWRERLTAVERQDLRSRLLADPEAASTHAEEIELTRLIARLPDVPVSSNFTARVLDEATRAAAEGDRGHWSHIFRFRWLPRAAVALFIIAGGLAIVRVEHRTAERREYAQSVAALSEVSSMPSPDVLENFEAVRRLNQTPRPDEELLALLQ